MFLYNWRISVDGVTWTALAAAGIPVPSVASFRDHSARTPRAGGGVYRHGYQRAEILWQRLSRQQAWTLKTSYFDAVGAGKLYMTIPRLDGWSGSYGWIDISGYPDLSDIEPVGPMLLVRGDVTHQNIVLTLNNVTIESTAPVF